MLENGCLTNFEVNNKEYFLITNARFYIKLTKTLEFLNENNASQEFIVNLFLTCIDRDKTKVDTTELNEYELKEVLNEIYNFYYCTYEKINDYKPIDNKVYNKPFDYEIDGGRIFSAFYRTYGIDIESQLDTIHWWKFRAMFDDLDSDSAFISFYRHFRNYENPDKIRKEEREKRIKTNIAIASFGTKNNVVLEESPLAKRRRIARENK